MLNQRTAQSMRLRAIGAALLATATACSGPSEAPKPKASGKLTVDGTASVLRHAYAIRLPFSIGDRPSDPYIEVLLTDQPIPAELFPKIEDALRRSVYEDTPGLTEVLAGTSLRVLSLQIPKDQGNEAPFRYTPSIYDARLTMVGQENRELASLSVRGGVVSGRAAGGGAELAFITESGDSRMHDAVYSYEAEFEVAITGSPLAYAGRPAVDSLPPLVPGTVDGTLTIDGRTSPLTAVYARRRKLFFDEPEERVMVAVTDKALPKAALLDSLDQIGTLTVEQDLRTIELAFDQFGRLERATAHDHEGLSQGVLVTTPGFEPVEYRVEGDRAIGRIAYKDAGGRVAYTVRFDVPITPG